MGQVLSQRYKASRKRPQVEKGCVRAPGKEEEGEERGLLLAEAQRSEIPLSVYSGNTA